MREWFQALSTYQNLPSWSPDDPEPTRRSRPARSRAGSFAQTLNRLLWPWVRGYHRRRRVLARAS